MITFIQHTVISSICILLLVVMGIQPRPAWADVEIVDYGLCRVENSSSLKSESDFPDSTLSSPDVSLIEKTNIVNASKEACFGVLFSAPLADSENLGLGVQMRHPPITMEDGSVQDVTELPFSIFTDKPSFVGWRFHSSNELLLGDWAIEFTNDTQVVARQLFVVQDTSVEGSLIGIDPYRLSGEFETVTRYLVQVATHYKHDNMIAYEDNLKNMGLIPFSFVRPCDCPHKNIYLTFVKMTDSRIEALAQARSMRDLYGIDAIVTSMEVGVPVEWPSK